MPSAILRACTRNICSTHASGLASHVRSRVDFADRAEFRLSPSATRAASGATDVPERRTKGEVDKRNKRARKLRRNTGKSVGRQVMAITFVRLQEYLDAVARRANLNVGNSRHGVFWNSSYQAFMTGIVPNKHCNGQVVPIVDPKNKVDSAFSQILRGPWCGMPQMPKTGPFVTDPGYFVTLADGTRVEGDKILADIQAWLEAGAPENGS